MLDLQHERDVTDGDQCPDAARDRRCNRGSIELLVEEQVIVEVKAIAELAPIHEAQLLTYLRLSNRPVGLLINFNTKVLAHGVRRLLNGRLPP